MNLHKKLYSSKKAPIYLNPCDSIIAPLKEAKVYIEKLAKKKDFVGEINPSWQFCESDNECTRTKNKCEKPIGVNKKYQKDYLEFLKTKKSKPGVRSFLKQSCS